MSEMCLSLSWGFLKESAREVLLSAEACPSGELLHKPLIRHGAHLPQGALIMMRGGGALNWVKWDVGRKDGDIIC